MRCAEDNCTGNRAAMGGVSPVILGVCLLFTIAVLPATGEITSEQFRIDLALPNMSVTPSACLYSAQLYGAFPVDKPIQTLDAARAAFAVYLNEVRADFNDKQGLIVTKTTMNICHGWDSGTITVYALDVATGSVLATASHAYHLDGGFPKPPNDDFPGVALPALSVGTPFVVSGTQYFYGSREGGEPLHAGSPVFPFLNRDTPVGCSVWWYWDAPADLDGSCLLHVCVGGGGFSVLAVYMGNSVDTLHEVASNADGLQSDVSQVDFVPEPGKRYHIAVAETAPPPTQGDCPEIGPCDPPKPVYPVFYLMVALDKIATHASTPGRCWPASPTPKPQGWGCIGQP